MNPYAKIAIKVSVVILICLMFLLAYNILGHSVFMKQKRNLTNEKNIQDEISRQLAGLLEYKDILPQIRHVQLQDLQTLRNLMPDADEFVMTSYLRLIHGMLAENHLETNGISITGRPAPTGGSDFNSAFTSDITALQEDLNKIKAALTMFTERMDEMNNLLISFQFYEQLSTDAENFTVIAGGIETHVFSMRVVGSYEDIKKFAYEIFNMRPHTALVNFQMAPAGAGFGATRPYGASFRLVTYGDANNPPPLWLAHNQGIPEVFADDEEVEDDGEGDTDDEGGTE